MKYAMMLLALGLFSQGAHAATRVEQKIFQFGGPETRTRCIKEWKTKGLPACTMRGFELKCEETWMSGCSEWATDLYQHEYFLVAEGPDLSDDYLRTLFHRALERALTVSVGVAIATPGEVGIKAAAGYASFKIAIAAELSVSAALQALAKDVTLKLDQRGSW